MDHKNGGIIANAMKVLVVEDNRKLARFLPRALHEEGCIVDIIEDGRIENWCGYDTRLAFVTQKLGNSAEALGLFERAARMSAA